MRWHLSTAVACSRLSGNRFKIRKLFTAQYQADGPGLPRDLANQTFLF